MNNNDLISREATLEHLEIHIRASNENTISGDVWRAAYEDVQNMPAIPITGETSDGYHSFNELYHHRAVLFSVIVKAFPERAWKARRHHDGTMYDGMFIVGIDTPEGQASYHYDIDPYWDMFDCRELERAPEWDEHTPSDAIERIGHLEPVRHGKWIKGKHWAATCSECGCLSVAHNSKNYCSNCGAKMDKT